jgi:peptidoglycan/xylan/chitin deacetylase (PgdA/CDA1 family)
MIRNYLFHRVSPKPDLLWPPMEPKLFEQIIRYLTGNFKVILLEDYLRDPLAYKGEKSLATVCFDDGYRDNLEVAAGILQRHRCPASFYVVTDCIDQNLPTWTYITDHVFQQDGKRTIQLDGEFVPIEYRLMAWATKEQGSEWGKKVKPWMKSLPNRERMLVMEQLSNQHTGTDIPDCMMMNWEEVKQLRSAGFYIGSHSKSHPMLASLSSEEEIRHELQSSAERLKDKMGQFPLTISYPIGSWDERVVRVSRECGYSFGLAVEQRFYKPESDSVYAIPRVELYNESWWKSRLRISGLYQTVKKLVK